MALVAMDLQILEDIDGQPGAPLVRPLESGETFFVEIQALERGDQIDGLGGVSLDIMWNIDHLRSLESNDTLTAAITDDLPMFRSGTLQADLGRILNLSGASYESAGVGRRIGDGEFEHFAFLRFEAITPTSLTEITLLEGISQTATYPSLSLRHEDHDFDVEMIEIVAADPQTTLPEQEPDTSNALPDGEVVSPETNEPTKPDAADPSPITEPTDEITFPTSDESKTTDDVVASTDANSDVTLSLVADATGEVQIGDLITIDVQVSESDPDAAGVGGISIDVDWDPSELQLVNPGSITDTITENFPGFQGGSVDTAAGFIDELTGASFESAGIGRAIGDGVAETFVTLTFVALKPTDGSSITVSLGDGGVGLVGDTSGAPIDVADAQTNVEIATAALPPLIQISTSGTDGGLEFAASGDNGVQSTMLRPGSVDSLQYIEIANVGETVLEVYEIQLGVDGLSIAANDLALADGFKVAPGQSQRIAVEFSAGEAGSVNASEGIVVVSNAGNRGRYAISTTAETTFAADLNLDGRVNIADVVLLDSVFGQTRGDGMYSESHDPNLDGSIDLGDFGLLNAQFGMQRSAAAFTVADIEEDDDSLDSTLDLLALDALNLSDGVR
ncbi:hypothetical protein Poly24_40490 [Rosistilla carotiformis]|uniref:Cohesin domain protein n=2 Tax=Rosistilla carotiformis TaxID=2528017 RepID=A0A518JXR3_9BACT|nr:hypothetical protein Poly24_40490 [Rosistilla carotiformis]